MRIALDVMYRLQVGGGSLIHLRQLLASWFRTGADREHDIVLVTRVENLATLGGDYRERLQVHPVGTRPLSTPAGLMWEQAMLPRLLRTLGADVVLCGGNLSPFRCAVPTVVMVRNALPFCPSHGTSRAGSSAWWRERSLRLLMTRSAMTSTRVMFPSDYVMNLFLGQMALDPDKIDVVHHGRDSFARTESDPALLATLGIRTPFLLSVAHLYRYKSLPVLVEGYARSGLSRDGIQLVLVGKETDRDQADRVRATIHHHGLEEAVLLAGPVEHVQIPVLLGGCRAFVFQSTCENYPNALVEALAAGVPIASSKASSMPEIAGDAATYFDPRDPDDIARALRAVACNEGLRADLGHRARERARGFPTWDDVGRQTLESLTAAAAAR